MKSETNSALNLSIPGFNVAFNTNNKLILKLIWLLLMLICTIMCLYFLTGRITHYFNYPVVLTYEVAGSGSAIYPKISFCLSNSPEVHKVIGSHSPKSLQEDPYQPISYCFSWKAMSQCKDEIFWKRQLTSTGIAYTFNTEKFSKSLNPWIMHFDFKKDTAKGTWKILLHDNDDDVIYGCLLLSHSIELRYLNSFVFTRTQFIYENVPVRPCIEADTYRKCLIRCLDQKLLNGSQCKLPHMESNGNWANCSTAVVKGTYKNAVRLIAELNSFSVCNCYRPCVDSHIEVDVDTSTENDRWATHITVYNSREEVAFLKEKRSFVLYALVCDIGGIIGLYLGACLLTFTEITHIIIKHLRWRLRKSGNPFVKHSDENNLKY
ncbi:hypothetical protein CHUAL_012364 [Chamberlinius hualienensis]